MIDVAKNNTHNVAFPSLVSAMMGTYKRVYNIKITANAGVDNGTLAGRGNWVGFDQYAQAALPTDGSGASATGWEGIIRGKAAEKDCWYVETTKVPTSGEVLFLYNSPVSKYSERSLQDEALWYNAKDEVVQGAPLLVGDIVSIHKNGFNGTPAANTAVTFANGKYVVGA